MFGYSPTGLVLTSFEIQEGMNKEEHTHIFSESSGKTFASTCEKGRWD
jgi:hypothetical protein